MEKETIAQEVITKRIVEKQTIKELFQDYSEHDYSDWSEYSDSYGDSSGSWL